MRSIIAALRTLVLPFGATSGRRIIIDGVNGVIESYDSNGDIRIQIGGSTPGGTPVPDRISLFSGDPDEGAAGLIETTGGARATLRLASPEVVAQSDRANIELSSPVNDPGLDRARVDVYGDSGRVDLVLQIARLAIDEGGLAPEGLATLVGGTVAVAHTGVTATSRIFHACQTPGGAQGFLSVVLNPGVGFTINSTSVTDTSTVAWLLVDAF